MNRIQGRTSSITLVLLLTVSTIVVEQGIPGGGFPYVFGAETPTVIGDYADPYRYDGEGVQPLDGGGRLEFDPLRDRGSLTVEVQTTEESGPIQIAEGVALAGELRLVMEEFFATDAFMQGGIAANLAAHGDTGVMTAAMPELALDYAGWGWIDVYMDGQLVYDNLVGHFMLGDRVRRSAGEGYTIFRGSDETIYSPSLDEKAGFIYSNEKELHLFVARSMAGIESGVAMDVTMHFNLLVTEDPEPGGGGGPGQDAAGGPETPANPDTGGGDDEEKGNNGIGNGVDPQPPGNPPVNDGGEDGKPGGGKGKK